MACQCSIAGPLYPVGPLRSGVTAQPGLYLGIAIDIGDYRQVDIPPATEDSRSVGTRGHQRQAARQRTRHMAPIREDKPTWGLVPVRCSVANRAPWTALASRVPCAPSVAMARRPRSCSPSSTAGVRSSRASIRCPSNRHVRWSLDEEARVYERIGDLIRPWAPELLRIAACRRVARAADRGHRRHAMPPWTRAARSAERHGRTRSSMPRPSDRALPGWLPREHHLEFAALARHRLTADDSAVGSARPLRR